MSIIERMLGTDISWIQIMPTIPQRMYKEEIPAMYGDEHWREMQEILGYYKVVLDGAPFVTNSTDDFKGADLKYKLVKQLLYKEARFMASKPLEFSFKVNPTGESPEAIQAASSIESDYKEVLDTILRSNLFDSKFVKAVKDCLIGKRVALVANFNEDGVQVNFLPSLEFITENDDISGKLIKFVAFYTIKESTNANERRIYKKRYELKDGFCHITEGTYDGLGSPIEMEMEDFRTELKFIPAVVILNDGLTGDTKGESEVEWLFDEESWYSKLANADIDAERRSMNPIRYTTDADPSSTKNLSTSAGAFWDLSTAADSDHSMGVGSLEPSMAYSGALDTTMSRIKYSMYDQLGVPNINLETMSGTITSGKGMRAVYWDLIVRVEEKMLAWKPALETFVKYLIEGCRIYKDSMDIQMNGIEYNLPKEPFQVTVENRYPIMEDETEEKTMDLAEVNSKTMSRKAYMKKWRNMSDEDIDAELKQIAAEREFIENSFGGEF